LANTPPDFEEMLAAMSAMSSMPSLASMASNHTELMAALGAFDPIKVVMASGGLLTVPQLQSNCLRLEALAHLALFTCNGNKKPQPKHLKQWFADLGQGPCGRLEDPAEEVFVGWIVTRRGNFRVIGGTWVGAAFYLQRIVNAVEEFPDTGRLGALKESVYALLTLSDAVCQRAGLVRHGLGNDSRESELADRFANTIDRLRQHVTFSRPELEKIGVDTGKLAGFIFDPARRDEIRQETLGHTLLERFPVLAHGSTLYLALPTGVTTAIRRAVIELVDAHGIREKFLARLAAEYSRLMNATPLLGKLSGVPLTMQSNANNSITSVMQAVDKGRYLHLVFYFDDLADFSSGGLDGRNPEPEGLGAEISRAIDWAHKEASAQPDFRDGITLVVSCGIGRDTGIAMPRTERLSWHEEIILTAPDLVTLSWLPEMSPLLLWRLAEAEASLSNLNVTLQNASGLLNLIAWLRKHDGHLVPHQLMPAEMGIDDVPNFIVIDQNGLRRLRHEALTHWDAQSVQNMRGNWVKVRRPGGTFEEDLRKPLYATEDVSADAFSWTFLAERRAWWTETKLDDGVSRRIAYNIEQMMSMWLSRMAPVLDGALATLPAGPVLLHTTFKGDIAALADRNEPLTFDETKAEIAVSVSPEAKTVSLVASERFQAAHYNERNIAERALVCCAVDGFVELAGTSLSDEEKNALIDRIVLNDKARQTHKFRLRSFRDHVQGSISLNPIMLDRIDGQTSKLGLGWRIRDRKLGGDIAGKAESIGYLNKLVRLLEDDLCNDLRRFHREAIIELALRTHESAALSKNQWERTASALLGLRDDQAAATAEMAKHGFQLNAVFLATRLLIEVALCECPLQGGLEPGNLDLTRLMSRAAAIPMYGGWSDAIRWDAMEPTLKVRPLGDVHAAIADLETLMESYARAGSDLRLAEAVENYGLHLQEPPINPTVEGVLAADFLTAWADEFGASFDDLRRFVDCIEDMGIKANEAVLKVPKSRLSTLSHETIELGPDVTGPLVESLILQPRQNWRDVPPGYDERDRHPWRFRRRLSVLRKPLIQIDDKDDPTILIAPGMLRDGIGFMLSGYHRGDFPRWQLKPQMRQWTGRSSDRRGKEFNREVAARLEALGWKVDTEVAMTKLLGIGFERNYGDVDVLAWRRESGRVLIVECKDVQYRKTYGEISEQLSDFRGDLRADGKPDYLLRHLNRFDLASKHADKVKAYVKATGEIQIQSHLVFKNPVPMQFALKRLEERVSVHLVGELARLSLE
jgi:hypothetical protein